MVSFSVPWLFSFITSIECSYLVYRSHRHCCSSVVWASVFDVSGRLRP